MSKNCKHQEPAQDTSENSSRKSSSFEERSNNIFSSIDKLEKLKPDSSLYQQKASSANESLRAVPSTTKDETDEFRNRESIFKLSEREESGWPPPNKLKPNTGQWERGRSQDTDFGKKSNPHSFKRPFNRQRAPDHTKNPSKYTKYSLSDAPNVSDRSNTQTALSFLKELSDRKEKLSELKENAEENPSKIVFKRPRRNEHEDDPDLNNENASAISKRVLPEAVVGRGSSFKTSSKKGSKKAKNEIDGNTSEKVENKTGQRSGNLQTLSHLMYEDEDC